MGRSAPKVIKFA